MEVVQKLGHPDVLFNNAGATNSFIGPQGDIQSVSIEEFEATWRLNAGCSYLVSAITIFHPFVFALDISVYS
jgi:3-oxoacyl-[acyl-carrier protein] reductase